MEMFEEKINKITTSIGHFSPLGVFSKKAIVQNVVVCFWKRNNLFGFLKEKNCFCLRASSSIILLIIFFLQE